MWSKFESICTKFIITKVRCWWHYATVIISLWNTFSIYDSEVPNIGNILQVKRAIDTKRL